MGLFRLHAGRLEQLELERHERLRGSLRGRLGTGPGVLQLPCETVRRRRIHGGGKHLLGLLDRRADVQLRRQFPPGPPPARDSCLRERGPLHEPVVHELLRQRLPPHDHRPGRGLGQHHPGSMGPGGHGHNPRGQLMARRPTGGLVHCQRRRHRQRGGDAALLAGLAHVRGGDIRRPAGGRLPDFVERVVDQHVRLPCPGADSSGLLHSRIGLAGGTTERAGHRCGDRLPVGPPERNQPDRAGGVHRRRGRVGRRGARLQRGPHKLWGLGR